MKDIYEVGQQPCQNLARHIEGNAHAQWENIHYCIYCRGSEAADTVSWCENCHRDHHAYGYETCAFSGVLDGLMFTRSPEERAANRAKVNL